MMVLSAAASFVGPDRRQIRVDSTPDIRPVRDDSFDNLGRAGEDRLWDCEPERLGAL